MYLVIANGTRRARRIRHMSGLVLLAMCGCALEAGTSEDLESLEGNTEAATTFGVTASGGFLTVSSEAGLVYKVRQSSGDITSIQWNGRELNDTSKSSHLSSGLGTAAVGFSVSPSGSTVVVTIATATVTHYLSTRRNDNTIYMATNITAEPTVGELRWITRLQSGLFNNVPVNSDIRNGTAIESTDIFSVNGQTRSKYYGKQHAKDLTIRGVTGNGVGVFMAYGNRESSSGGPFFVDIQNQTGSDAEVYNYMNSGHNQTEANRVGVLHGPYALVFTNGSTPAVPDMSWMSSLGLKGWVSSRGSVSGRVAGVTPGIPALVGFRNATAQYWATPDGSGNFVSPPMKPGTYTQVLFQGELEIATHSVTVTASTTLTGQDITSAWANPATIWRIGRWDGTPLELKNGPNIGLMHPSDSRNASWGPTTFNVGSAANTFSAAQWVAVNNPTTIRFNLAANQVAAHTVRIGITAATAGGRPSITVNSFNSGNPSPSNQPSSRSLTLGTYRGNNTLFTFNVPASAFVTGTNTLVIRVISGSSGTGFLSPGFSYDAVELVN
jgi:rhamnogalacturonan endolyase